MPHVGYSAIGLRLLCSPHAWPIQAKISKIRRAAVYNPLPPISPEWASELGSVDALRQAVFATMP